VRRLEEDGLARSVGVRGRVLTGEGERRLDILRLRQQVSARTASVAAAVDVRTLDELIDLLHARRAVEGEAARLAAVRASEDELSSILAGSCGHADCVDRHDRLGRSHSFHLLLARASRNRMLIAVSELLLDPRHQRLAALLDGLLASAGTLKELAADHEAIAQALQRRAADEAERLMRDHLGKLIRVATEHRDRTCAGGTTRSDGEVGALRRGEIGVVRSGTARGRRRDRLGVDADHQ
jgi:DNA-binding FadR family transcriptional regulator